MASRFCLRKTDRTFKILFGVSTMNKPSLWIALVCAAALIMLFISKRKPRKEVWETTPGGPYQVIVTDESISCTHPKRGTELIRWDEINEIRLVTTSDGPLLPDMWYLFVGDDGGCSVPSEAKGFDQLWDIFKTRFPGFDYQGIIQAGTSDDQRVLWKKSSGQALEATADPPPS